MVTMRQDLGGKQLRKVVVFVVDNTHRGCPLLSHSVPCCCVGCSQVLPELSLEDTALFFARAGAAAYDASITGWKVSWAGSCPKLKTASASSLQFVHT